MADSLPMIQSPPWASSIQTNKDTHGKDVTLALDFDAGKVNLIALEEDLRDQNTIKEEDIAVADLSASFLVL